MQTFLCTFLQAQVQYGYINLEEIFRDSTRLSAVDLSSLLLAKIAATSVCVGGGLVGGLFAPSLFIGALVGDVMGHFVANRCVVGCNKLFMS
jgi:H+/Cl- antiporter ClcA